jgi:ubiquinone/menaquinone biosynthesis C-methylase UbiE
VGDVRRESGDLAGVEDSGNDWGGVIVHVGCGDGRATAALVRHATTDRVQGLDRDPASIELARQHALPLDLDGRLTFKPWRGGGLPYTDSLVNVLVWDRAAGEADGTRSCASWRPAVRPIFARTRDGRSG